MKKYITKITKILSLSTLALYSSALLGGCNFLEVNPVGQTTIPLFFSDMDGIRAAIPGAYSSVYNYYSSEFYLYPDVAGNMLFMNGIITEADMLSQYNFTSNRTHETQAVGKIWQNCYIALANVNNILMYAPALAKKFPHYTDELRAIRAEALFLRALCHFDLVRCYGQPYNFTSDASHWGVPYLHQTPGADDNVARNTVKEVYDYVISDLRDSEDAFGGKAMVDAYHASKLAAQALLSRVYLYRGNWDECILYSSRVIAEKQLTRDAEYIKMYNAMEVGSEAIFRLNGTLKSASLNKFYSAETPKFIPADTLLQLFESTDIRLSLLRDNNGQRICRKYLISIEVPDLTKRYDPFVLRVSEMYLNRAEAYCQINELDKAAADVSEIIARGLNVSLNEVHISYTGKEELMRIIDRERAKELCFEGHQFFDIARRGQPLIRESITNSAVRYIPYPDKRFVLPVPGKELDANHNIVPNPEY